MFDRLGSLVEDLKRFVTGLDPAEFDGDAAMDLLSVFAEGERVCAAGKLLAAERVTATGVWQRGGSRSAADWLARRCGIGSGPAGDMLETAARLASCPLVEADLRSGRLSDAQAHVIADAVSVRPEAEAELVEFARKHSLRQLRDACRQAKNGAASAEADAGEVHRRREVRFWSGRDGALCFNGRLGPEVGAEFLAVVEDRKQQILRAARKAGEREPFDAYAADALVQLVTEERGVDGGKSRPKAMLMVHVSYETIMRGAVAGDELCEVDGLGPVPYSVVRSLSTDSILRVLVADGPVPVSPTPGVRTIPRSVRLQVEARYRECIVDGCDVRRGLEIDHVDGWELTQTHDPEKLVRLCKRHHNMKSYQGWRVGGRYGQWTWEPPDDYRDPEPDDPAVGTLLACDPWTGRQSDAAADDPGRRHLVGAAASAGP